MQEREGLPVNAQVIEAGDGDGRHTVIFLPATDSSSAPTGKGSPVSLEDLVLAYMGNASTVRRARQTLEVLS